VTPAKKRVLFVCLGNACRSQMAEGFARTYGSDVLVPASAGLTPAAHVAPDTRRAMAEKNIDIRDQFPKSIRNLGRATFDLAINMSGFPLPGNVAASEDIWDVDDPVFMEYEDHCGVRDEIERMVMKLILDLRRAQQAPPFRSHGSASRP
jgi:arsenate reductase